MSRSKVTLWVRLLLGVAVIVGGPLILIAVLRTAYQSSPEPGKIDPGTFEFGKLGPSSPAPRPTDSPRPPAVCAGYARHAPIRVPQGRAADLFRATVRT